LLVRVIKVLVDKVSYFVIRWIMVISPKGGKGGNWPDGFCVL
jgi:hypothetical protein